MGGIIRTEGRWTSRDGGTTVIDYGDYEDGLDDSVRIHFHDCVDGIAVVAKEHQSPYTAVASFFYPLDKRSRAEEMARKLVEIAVASRNGGQALRKIYNYRYSLFHRFLRFIARI